MKQIIWHIGFRKTGTTSVQYLLAHLPADKVPGLFISSRDRLTRPWRELIIRATRTKTRPDLNKVRAEIAKVAASLRDVPQDTILISDENLFAFALFDRSGGHFFDRAADILPLIEQAFSDFDNIFVAYTRPWESWLKSSYSQEVKRGRTSRSFEAWRKQVPASCNWTDGLGTIRAAIRSPLVLLTHDEDTVAGFPLGTRLLELAGVPRPVVAEIGPVPRLNESLSADMLRLFRFFNLFGLNSLIRGVIHPRIRARELARKPSPSAQTANPAKS